MNIVSRKNAPFYFAAGLLFVYNVLLCGIPQTYVKGFFNNLFYFLSYRVEFMKRGLIGTILSVFNIPVTERVISIIFIASVNIFYVLMFLYSRYYIYPYNKKLFYFLFGLFVISPFAAWNWGYDYSRSDIYLLVIELLVLYILRKDFNTWHYIIPFLLVAGILIHEGFLFLNAPVILAVMLYKYRQKLLPLHLIQISCVAILSCMIIVTLYGNVSKKSLEIIYFTVYNKPLPRSFSSLHPTAIITGSLKSNILFSFNYYFKVATWKPFLIVIPYLFCFIYLYKQFFFSRKFSFPEKLIFISPFLSLPVFVLGIDIYRWISIIFMNILITAMFLYKLRPFDLTGIDKKRKLAVGIVLFYCLAGPLGVIDDFPYLRRSGPYIKVVKFLGADKVLM